MPYVYVDVDLDKFDDEEIKQEYNRRFNRGPNLSIDFLHLDDVYNFISKHYWSPEQWDRLQDEISNAMRYGK